MGVSLLVASISAAGALGSTKAANQNDKNQAILGKYQDAIDIERMKGDVAIEAYNMTMGLSEIEAEQAAMAPAMGKRTDGPGYKRMQEVQREDLADNLDRMDKEVARAKKYGQITGEARGRMSESNRRSRTTQAVTTGLMSFAQAFNTKG